VVGVRALRLTASALEAEQPLACRVAQPRAGVLARAPGGDHARPLEQTGLDPPAIRRLEHGGQRDRVVGAGRLGGDQIVAGLGGGGARDRRPQLAQREPVAASRWSSSRPARRASS
jgi:hypothetical protein